MKFGEYLVKNQIVTSEAISDAIEIQKRHKKKKLGRLLVELEQMNQSDLNCALMGYLNPKYPNSILKAKEESFNFTPTSKLRELSRKYNAFPLSETRESITFIQNSVISDKLLEETEEATEKDATSFFVTQKEFEFLIQSTDLKTPSSHNVVVSRNLTDDDKLNENTPYAKLFKEALGCAKEDEVSDIHIEPLTDGVVIRFRLFGILKTYKTLTKEHSAPLISKVKNVVNLDLAIVGKPQDSRASFKTFKVDLRASSLPVLHGEKIVLRLLDQDKDFDLKGSGLSNSSYRALTDVIKKRDGMILISGPTGSGKTTTLYSLLCELDRKSKNISTLENPVEYELSGINQVNISDYLSFSDSLKALMRQDPDVILFGEIRDNESAKNAFKAASTGHLVLSTVHAPDAKGVIERLTNMGVDKFSIKSSLRLSAAQRLVPIICPVCSVQISERLLEELMRELPIGKFKKNKLKSRNPKGCSNCKDGIIGRSAILEYMTREDIKDFVDNPDSYSISTSLKDATLELANIGSIDAREVLEIS